MRLGKGIGGIFTDFVLFGDVISLQTPGGGGYGEKSA
jgi:N-methylhydantoinase B/oxoprolinase/acetone carboxylase alpha subunit